MKKISLFLIPLLIISMIFTSCGNRDYDEAVVKAAAREILEKSAVVNEIFYGVGIPYTENSSLSSGNYKLASDEYLSAIGVSSIEGLKNMVREVYTKDLCEIIFNTTLESVKDSSGNIAIYSRYNERNTAQGDFILVYSLLEPLYENDVEYLYDTLSVIGSDGEYIHVRIDVTLTTFDGFSRTERGVEFILLEEEDGFRLDTPSFIKY